MALKRENLQQILKVDFMTDKYHLSQGFLIGYQKERDRYVIKRRSGTVVAIKVDAVTLPPNASVLIRNLRTNTCLNGKYGTVVRYEDNRYLVAVDKGQLVRLRGCNILA